MISTYITFEGNMRLLRKKLKKLKKEKPIAKGRISPLARDFVRQKYVDRVLTGQNTINTIHPILRDKI